MIFKRGYFVALLLSAVCAGSASAFTLTAPGGEDAAILEPDSLSSVVKYGVADFQDDARDVLGHRLPVVTEKGHHRALIIAGVAGRDARIDLLVRKGKIDVSKLKGLWESYVITPVSHPFPGVDEALVVAGSDERGALFGLYEISESVFGTDPLKFWTDHVPPHLDKAEWRRGTVFQGEPSFRFRGFYVNDENFLMGWKGRGDDIEPELWAKIFETILRLRCNTCSQVDYAKPMTPETVALMRDRGLYITGSHVNILLSNPMAGWAAFTKQIGMPDLPYSFVQHPEQMEAFWKTGVVNFSKEHVLWPIGLRWTDDRDFYEGDTAAPADWPSRGKIVNDAVAAEMKVLHDTLPKGDGPVAVFSMRGQAHLRAFQEGYLHLPEDAINLYNDKGSSATFLNPPTPEEIQAHGNNGIYYHLTYCDDQWVQWVSPELIEQQLSGAVHDGITRMAILNVGDIRELPLSIAAATDFVYNDSPWMAKEPYAPAFTEKWCRYQYGDKAGPAVAQLLSEYFPLAYTTRASAIIEAFQQPLLCLLPKVFKGWMDRSFVSVAQADAGYPDRLAQDIGGYVPGYGKLSPRFGKLSPEYLNSVEDKWTDLEKRAMALADEIPDSARPFYYFSITLQIKSSKLANEFGISMFQAIAAVKNKRFDEAASKFQDAARQILAFKAIRQPAATGKWAGWYNGEEITGWDGIPWGVTSSWSVHSDRAAAALEQLAAICRAQLVAGHSAELPKNSAVTEN